MWNVGLWSSCGCLRRNHGKGSCSNFFLSPLLVKPQTLKRAQKNPKGDVLIIELPLLGKSQCVEIAFHISQRTFVLLLLPQDCKHQVNASIWNGVLWLPLSPVFFQYCACPLPSACFIWTALVFIWWCSMHSVFQKITIKHFSLSLSRSTVNLID